MTAASMGGMRPAGPNGVNLYGVPTEPGQQGQQSEAALRAQAMLDAWNGYRGNLPDPLKVPKGGPNDNIRTNRLRPIVRKTVSWLFPPDFSFQVEPADADDADDGLEDLMDYDPDDSGDGGQSADAALPDAAPGAPSAPPVPGKPSKPSAPPKPKVDPALQAAQDALDAVWNANGGDTLLRKWATNGAIFGHAYLRIIPDGLAHQGQPLPRLVNLDPMRMSVVCDPDDVERATEYRLTWPITLPDPNDPNGKRRDAEKRLIFCWANFDPTAPPTTPQQWTITEQVKLKGSDTAATAAGQDSEAGWQTTNEELWPYPFSPIVDCQNLPEPNVYYGSPDLAPDLIQLNKQINFAKSNMNRILRFHGHPKTYGTGFMAAQLETNVDGVIVLPNPDAKLQNLEMQDDLGAASAFVQSLMGDMDELSNVPAVAFGRQESMPSGDVSGVAIRLRFMPLLEHTSLKQGLYGPALEKANHRLLVIMGKGDQWHVACNWPDPMPVDEASAAANGAALIAMGVSKDTVFRKLGLDPKTELAKSRAEKKSNVAAAQSMGLQPGMNPALAAHQATQQPGQPVAAPVAAGGPPPGLNGGAPNA
jgi:hypothetical protein